MTTESNNKKTEKIKNLILEYFLISIASRLKISPNKKVVEKFINEIVKKVIKKIN